MAKEMFTLYELNKDIKLISYNQETKEIIYKGIKTGLIRKGILEEILRLSNGTLSLKIKPLEIIEEKNKTKKKKERIPGI